MRRFVLCVALGGAGCAGLFPEGPPAYRIVVAATEPLSGQRCYVSASPIQYARTLTVDGMSRSELEAKMNPGKLMSFEADLRAMNAAYISYLEKGSARARTGEQAPLRFVPRVSQIQLGEFIHLGNKPTEMVVVVDVVDAKTGTIVEQLEMPQMIVSQAAGRFSSGQRLEDEGGMLGNRLARYLERQPGCSR